MQDRKLEKIEDALLKLTLTVTELSVNVNHLAKNQEVLKQRVRDLEKSPLENYKYYKRIFYAAILSAIGGSIAGVFIKIIVGGR